MIYSLFSNGDVQWHMSNCQNGELGISPIAGSTLTDRSPPSDDHPHIEKKWKPQKFSLKSGTSWHSQIDCSGTLSLFIDIPKVSKSAMIGMIHDQNQQVRLFVDSHDDSHVMVVAWLLFRRESHGTRINMDVSWNRGTPKSQKARWCPVGLEKPNFGPSLCSSKHSTITGTRKIIETSRISMWQSAGSAGNDALECNWTQENLKHDSSEVIMDSAQRWPELYPLAIRHGHGKIRHFWMIDSHWKPNISCGKKPLPCLMTGLLPTPGPRLRVGYPRFAVVFC